MGPEKAIPAEAVKRPNLTPAVSPKYLSDETKIYIFINRIPWVAYRIFLEFFKIFIFPTLGRYLQTSALKGLSKLSVQVHCVDYDVCSMIHLNNDVI